METYNQNKSSDQAPSAAGDSIVRPGDEINLVDVLIVLAKRKKLLIGAPLVAAVLSIAVALVLPNSYMAAAKLLPPQQAQSGASALLAQLGGAASLAGVAGLKSPGELYIGILKSRTIADRLINRFSLKKAYGVESPEKARRQLAANTVLTAGKDGLITISVEDEDKKLVASIANGYVAELQLLTKTLAVTEAAQRRLFFEQQLEATKDNLARVEMALKGAMNNGGVISVDAEGQSILATTARIKAQVSAKEVQIGAMRAFVTTENPEFKRATQDLISLRSELAKLEGGRGGSDGQGGTKVGGLENIQLMRDLKYTQMLYELLAKQYEVARLDEAKDSAIIQVLDYAAEPEFKSKPKRAIIVIATTLFAFFAAVAWALVSAGIRKASAQPAGALRWAELRSSLRF